MLAPHDLRPWWYGAAFAAVFGLGAIHEHGTHPSSPSSGDEFSLARVQPVAGPPELRRITQRMVVR